MNLENISKKIIDFIFDTEEVSTKKLVYIIMFFK